MQTTLLRLILFLIFCFLTCPQVYAQRQMQDVLYLKNGSILRGKLTELNADTIKIEITGGNIFVFPALEAKGVTKEKPVIAYKQTGYRFTLENGLLIGRTPKGNSIGANQRTVSYSLQMVNSLQLRPELAIGAGVGIDAYNSYTITPVYLRLHGTLFNKPISPLYMLDAGYGFYSHIFNSADNSEGGLMVNPAIGVSLRMGRRSAFIVNVGYRHQEVRRITSFGTPGEGIIEKSTFKRVSIRAGFIF
ncbi:hypothetical protein GXP67_23770 [Rhodocytophaga rosea]|uniref:Outer membrane beta-barrel protein n=1 Tax=Rhodocytophaga rosea TaxID=2704465 RepID=A0A6C0GPA0_9BACT|nr:hypothetical protein [Rhodocytophaga rosea]QHT69443.1 hypothetical protein GXP67_23770 [Rhodocytophaga rosea]